MTNPYYDLPLTDAEKICNTAGGFPPPKSKVGVGQRWTGKHEVPQSRGTKGSPKPDTAALADALGAHA